MFVVAALRRRLHRRPSLNVTRPQSIPSLKILLPPVAASIVTNLAFFFVGMFAPQIREGIGLDQVGLGLTVSAYAIGGVASGIIGGRFADRVGARSATRCGVVLCAISMLAIATVSHSLVTFAIPFCLAGVSNSVAASGTSLYLVRAVERRRLGLAFGLRQAAGPTATIVTGLCVPLVAGDINWRWPFVVAAALALVTAVATPGLPGSRGVVPIGATSAPRHLMVRLAIGSAFASLSTVALATFLVESAVLSGVPNGRAGFVVAASGVFGLVMRLMSGIRADRRDGGNLSVVCRMLFVATAVFVLLSIEEHTLFYLAAPLAYSASWGYQALLQLSIARGNTRAPGSAAGLVQTGSLTGALVGPPILGWLARDISYSAMWLAAGAGSFVAASLFLSVVRAARHLAEPGRIPSDVAHGQR